MTRTIDQMIAQEVLCCMSSIVATLADGAGMLSTKDGDPVGITSLAEQAYELASPIEDYEEAAIQAGWSKRNDGVWWRTADAEEGDDGLRLPIQLIRAEDACAEDNIEPYAREVFEHWAVTDWLADRLIAQGERVDKDFGALCVWARTTSGQGIAADGVIERIYNETHGPFPVKHGDGWVLAIDAQGGEQFISDGFGKAQTYPTESAAYSAALDILLGRTEPKAEG